MAKHGTVAHSFSREEGGLTRCPFGLLAAVLSLAVWHQVGVANISEAGGVWSRMDAGGLLDLYVLPLLKVWEERSKQFFFDLMVTHWRILDLFDALGEEYLHRVPVTAYQRTSAMPSPQPPARRPPIRRRAFTETAGEHLQVLFLGGSTTTVKWTSFTQRGKQLSRGLRSLPPSFHVDARSWNAECSTWCRLHHGTSSWIPNVIVHIKSICRCALALWRHVLQIYDPVDTLHWRDALAGGRYLAHLDVIFMSTSLGQQDLQNHPSLLALANVSAEWFPLHHSNFLGTHLPDISSEPTRIGVHTVHKDERLQATVTRTLSRHGTRRGAARFLHLDPGVIFKSTQGRIVTPQQTARLYQQIAGLDIAVVRQSGCRSEWWFCSRWRTGQRLVNHLSVGVPVVVWADSQGHIDVLRGLWPPRDLSRLPQKSWQYPPELIVATEAEAEAALAALLRNSSLRQQARYLGLALSATFDLPRLAAQLTGILRRHLFRTRFKRPWWRRRQPGKPFPIGSFGRGRPLY
eukprot:TRINITY_DN120844_c0_g1_i1.p1 TRINITY_DN120844_c0_g1~~TRINITY_DN120844_c0_g1_i1.p1  ORF type:complete len:598 (-),score=39.03 TRINITY_DN120844_c0_g1_i1:97-1650(-)